MPRCCYCLKLWCCWWYCCCCPQGPNQGQRRRYSVYRKWSDRQWRPFCRRRRSTRRMRSLSEAGSSQSSSRSSSFPFRKTSLGRCRSSRWTFRWRWGRLTKNPIIRADNTHRWGKYHCTSDLLFDWYLFGKVKLMLIQQKQSSRIQTK